MFKSLFGWLDSFYKWVWSFFEGLFAQLIALLGKTWAVAVLAFGWLWSAAHWLVGQLGHIADLVQNIVFPAANHGTPWHEPIAFFNTFLPVDETFAFLVGYIGLCIGLTTYRLVKSWIPTLS